MGDPLVLAFGDSLTAGYGLPRHLAFPARLEALLRARRPDARVLNAGVSGETSAGGRVRLPRLLSSLDRRPHLAVVELGANDLLRGLPADATRANLQAIVEALTDCRVPVLLAGMRAPAFLGDVARRFNAVYPAVAARTGCALYPHFLAGVAGRSGLTLPDGVHPNAEAVALVAERVLPAVEAALDQARAAAA